MPCFSDVHVGRGLPPPLVVRHGRAMRGVVRVIGQVSFSKVGAMWPGCRGLNSTRPPCGTRRALMRGGSKPDLTPPPHSPISATTGTRLPDWGDAPAGRPVTTCDTVVTGLGSALPLCRPRHGRMGGMPSQALPLARLSRGGPAGDLQPPHPCPCGSKGRTRLPPGFAVFGLGRIAPSGCAPLTSPTLKPQPAHRPDT